MQVTTDRISAPVDALALHSFVRAPLILAGSVPTAWAQEIDLRTRRSRRRLRWSLAKQTDASRSAQFAPTSPIRIDGRLDESIYTATEAIEGFVQQEPDEGKPATERTEAWVLFDDDHVYVAARCWETQPARRVANEMRRDTSQLRQNDTFAVLFDTFHDRRNGYLFYANPIGGLADSQITDEGPPNVDWNTVWNVKTGRFDGGWTIEMAIPVQVPSLSSRARPDMGHQPATRRALEERVVSTSHRCRVR